MFRSLKDIESALAAGSGGAPVHLWNPELCGEIDMRIDSAGNWHYQDSPIGRAQLVRLFASVLKREGDDHFLVTPHEKLKIRVDDAPFLISEMKVEGEGRARKLHLATTLGQGFTAGPAHPLRFVSTEHAFKAYAEVRNGLEGLFSRTQTLALAELIVEHEGRQGIWSDGVFFALP